MDMFVCNPTHILARWTTFLIAMRIVVVLWLYDSVPPHACICLLQFIFPNAMGHPITAIVKTLLDQVLMAPAGIALFFQAMSMLEGHSVEEAWQSTKEKFKPTLMANYVLWPAANLVNFAFVPPAQRILYVNVVYVSHCY